jgi:hypothetical protein
LDKEDFPEFELIVNKIINNAELKNLSIEIIDTNKYKKYQFNFIIERMIQLGGGHLHVVFNHLLRVDNGYAKTLLMNLQGKFTGDENLEKISL